MTTSVSVKDEVKHQQNALIFKVFVFSVIVAFLIQLVLGRPLINVLLTVIMGTLTTGTIGVLHYLRKGTNIVPYVAFVGLTILILGFMMAALLLLPY
ncbi:DUF2921 domain-containing protein [Caldalkalibacillus mannanilyticus]|uniref:DUF2921 domain-containing protein n=1 Tax=Caldalkalibacillus mannanilyticus TaxID=1418 RepID=UPI000469F05E|nr:DUF2921 domain-containing protein [Caldalkalibacillus mannanilyticus]